MLWNKSHHDQLSLAWFPVTGCRATRSSSGRSGSFSPDRPIDFPQSGLPPLTAVRYRGPASQTGRSGHSRTLAYMTLIIRSETPTDHAAIEAVTVAAFLDAPHTDHNEQFIVAALRAAEALTLSIVAEVDAVVVGHVAVSPVSISGGVDRWFGIGPVSVIPRLHGRGIGTQLMRQALDELKKQGAAGCVVLGDPAYYKRFGFQNESGLVLPGVPPEYFMAVSFERTLPSGVVTYHSAFKAKQ